MNRSIRRISLFALAVAIGAVAFGFVWLPNVSAAAAPTACNKSKAVDMCYMGSTVLVKPPQQPLYKTKGATCGACPVSP
jgi:hypothetical protein